MIFTIFLLTNQANLTGFENHYYVQAKKSASEELIERFNKEEKVMEIHFLDVRNGEASLIITPNDKVIMIDGGSRESANYVVEYLTKKEINEIHYLIASTPYSSYIGGIPDVISNFNVQNILDSGTATNSRFFQNYLTTAVNKANNFKKKIK